MSKKKSKKKSARKTKASAQQGRTIERRDLVRILGISVRTFAELESQGVLIPLRRGRGGRASVYAIDTVIPAYITHVTSAPASGEERAARARHYKSQAMRNELAIQKETGDLLPREEVILAGKQQVKAWTAKLRALPRQLVQSGAVPRESERKVAAVLHDVLVDISGWQPVEAAR